MKKIASILLLVLFFYFIQPSSVFAEDQGAKKGAHYSGLLIGTGGVAGGASMSVDMYVDAFTSGEETMGLLKILQEKGQDGVVRELEKKDVGRVTTMKGSIVSLSVARRFESETGAVVRLFSVRPLHFLELYEYTRSTDYPFSLIELMLDKDGNGQGAVIVAAKIKITKEGRLELESRGGQYIKITNVRRIE